MNNGDTYTPTQNVLIVGWYRVLPSTGGGVCALSSSVKGTNFLVSSTADAGYYTALTFPVQAGESITCALTNTQGGFVGKVCLL